MANEHTKIVANGINQMVTKLYPEITSPTENLIFSPLSLHSILSLVYQGSSGSTEEAFKKALKLSDKQQISLGYESILSDLNNVTDITLEIANRVYIKNGYKMKSTFLDAAMKHYLAGAESIDFVKKSSASIMNRWVEEKTKNKIHDLILQEQLDKLTRMVLINAVYFKGDWSVPFDKEYTRPDNFYISETETVPCEMMFRYGTFPYKDDSGLGAQIIQLSYKNPAFCMLIVLPHSKTGLGKVEKKIVSMDLDKLTKNMKEVEVDLYLPKFRIESTIELKDPLTKIGLGEAFSDKANFTELLESTESLQISKVVQKAFIEVNEEGAEAAAATGFAFCPPMPAPPLMKIEMRTDHPFVYYITWNGVIVIFSGRLSVCN